MKPDFRLAITATEMEIRPTAPIVYRGPFEDTLPRIRALGYDGVEAHIHDSAGLDRVRLQRLLRENHLGLTSIGTGSAYGKEGLFLASPDGDIRRGAIERLNGHVDTAADYPDAVVIVGLIRGKIADCGDRGIYETNLLAALGECVAHAERREVTLVLEMVNRYESDCLHRVEEGLAFLERLPSPRLRLHLDTFHMNLEERDIPQAIRGAAGRIGHVHVADSDRWFPGHGHYDFGGTLAALREIGYNGALAAECLSCPDPDTAAEETIRNLRSRF